MVTLTKNLTTLDTIALKCDISLLKDFSYIREAFKSNNGTDDFDKKYYRLILKDTIKDFIYGLERLEIVKKETSEGIDNFIRLVINAKLLNNQYLEGLNKNNIKTALEYLTTKLKDFIKIKADDILNIFSVGYCDFTKNIKVINYNVIEYIRSINYHIITNRSLKKVRTAYMEAGTLNLMLSNKEKYIIYDKNNELQSMINDSKHKYFINDNKELLKLSENVLRLETRIIGKKRLSKILNIQLKNNDDYITLKQVLNNNINIAYNRLKSYIAKRKKDIISIDYSSMNNSKDYIRYNTGSGFYFNYKNDDNTVNYDKIKNDVIDKVLREKLSKRYAKQKIKAIYYNILDTITYYFCFNELKESKINYTFLFNEVMEKLEVA